MNLRKRPDVWKYIKTILVGLGTVLRETLAHPDLALSLVMLQYRFDETKQHIR